MRTILILAGLMAISASISAQNDFKTLDQKTYDLFNKGDYKILKKTGDLMLAEDMDYYYLRLRVGISAFNNSHYSDAAEHLTMALKFNSLDTISREYIYYSYVLSGRKADADLYLSAIPADKRNKSLNAIQRSWLTDVYAGGGLLGYDYLTYNINNLYYEAVKYNYNFYAGLDASFLDRFKSTLMYTNLRKTGMYFSALDSTGNDLNFTQNQFYAKVSGLIFPGWEFSGFGHFAFYTEVVPFLRPRFIGASINRRTDYVAGLGISKNWWKIRTSVNVSLSNFGNSEQVRGEGYITYLPYSSLNLYFTSGGMLQTDRDWGESYQIDEEVGIKIMRSVWLETGIMLGNSFLYARNMGNIMNNSFMIPSTTVYCNLILTKWKKLTLNISPFYSKNLNYSWNLSSFSRNNEINPNSFGIAIKLTYNNK
jgi:hypothetical protein